MKYQIIRRSFIAIVGAFFVIISGCKNEKPFNASDVILLVNSNTQAEVAITKVIPYLN